MVRQGGAKPVAILNKIDLAEKELLEEMAD
jgi:hypothetical protein